MCLWGGGTRKIGIKDQLLTCALAFPEKKAHVLAWLDLELVDDLHSDVCTLVALSSRRSTMSGSQTDAYSYANMECQ